MSRQILIFLASILYCVSAFALGINPDKVHLVVKRDLNYFFRGDVPVTNSGSDKASFDYEGLLAALKAKGLQLQPEQYHLVVISLLNPMVSSEYHDINAEKNFFANLPQGVQGELIEHPIYGALTDKQRLNAWFPDKLPKLIDQITDMLNTKFKDKPRIVYVHCHSGCDRTGAVVASYRMHDMGWDIQRAWEADESECGREVKFYSRKEIEKYCREYTSLSYCKIAT